MRRCLRSSHRRQWLHRHRLTDIGNGVSVHLQMSTAHVGGLGDGRRDIVHLLLLKHRRRVVRLNVIIETKVFRWNHLMMHRRHLVVVNVHGAILLHAVDMVACAIVPSILADSLSVLFRRANVTVHGLCRHGVGL